MRTTYEVRAVLVYPPSFGGNRPLTTIGLLGRFREALRDEMEEPKSKLAADYNSKLFCTDT